MNTMKRSLLYICKKPGKTIPLLLTVVILSSCILSLWSISRVSAETTLALKQTIGNTFTLKTDVDSQSDHWGTTTLEDGSISYIYEGDYPTEDMLNEIASLDGISGYNYRLLNYLSPYNADGGTMELVIPVNSMGDDGFYMVWIYAARDTSQDQYFTNGTLELAEGRFIDESDTNVVMVSDEFAAANGLQLGDSIILDITPTDSELTNAQSNALKVRIIGIYTVLAEQDPASVSAFNAVENLMYTDFATHSSFSEMVISEPVVFYVDDADKIDNIMSEVMKIEDIDWGIYYLEKNDQQYQNYASALSQLEKAAQALMMIGIISSVIILALTLLLRVKSRIHEIGLLISLGVGKMSIFGQLLIESGIATIVAVACSYFAASGIAQILSHVLLPSIEQSTEAATINNRTWLAMQTPTKLEISVDILVNDWVLMYFIFGIVIIFATLIAFSHIRKMQPREIMSRLS